MGLFGPRRVLLTQGIDPDVRAWSGAVRTNGGSVSGRRARLMSLTVGRLKSANLWSAIDYLGVYAGENAASCLVDWRHRLVGGLQGTSLPTFTVDRCMVCSGATTGWMDTGFNPSLNALAMTGTDQMIGVYEVTNFSVSGQAAGAFVATASRLSVGPRSGSNMTFGANFANGSIATIPVNDSRGLSCAYQTPAPLYGAAKNGASLGTITPGSTANTLLNLNIFVGGMNEGTGAAVSPRATNCGYLVMGSSAVALSPAFYQIMQAHMAAIGAAV